MSAIIARRRPGRVHPDPVGRRGRRQVRLPQRTEGPGVRGGPGRGQGRGLAAWAGLIKRGKDPVEVGVHGIATNAVRYVRNGRRVGNRPAAGAPWTFTTPRPRRGTGSSSSAWTPATTPTPKTRRGGRGGSGWPRTTGSGRPTRRASGSTSRAGSGACRPRKRRIAELLTEGHDGVTVARTAGVTRAGSVRSRAELDGHWEAFQAQAVAR